MGPNGHEWVKNGSRGHRDGHSMKLPGSDSAGHCLLIDSSTLREGGWGPGICQWKFSGWRERIIITGRIELDACHWGQ